MHFAWQAQYKRHVQRTCMFRGQGADFLRGCISEHQIFRFAILRDRCSTSYDLASDFRGRRSTLDTWTGKIAKRIGTRPSKIEEVLQNCFVLHIVTCENGGSLAE